MSERSLNDEVVRMLTEFNALELAMLGINDYGEPTGFRSDFDQLRNDLNLIVAMNISRIENLRYRVSLYNKENTDAPTD